MFYIFKAAFQLASDIRQQNIGRMHLCEIYTIPAAVSLFQFLVVHLLYNPTVIMPCTLCSLIMTTAYSYRAHHENKSKKLPDIK